MVLVSINYVWMKVKCENCRSFANVEGFSKILTRDVVNMLMGSGDVVVKMTQLSSKTG